MYKNTSACLLHVIKANLRKDSLLYYKFCHSAPNELTTFEEFHDRLLQSLKLIEQLNELKSFLNQWLQIQYLGQDSQVRYKILVQISTIDNHSKWIAPLFSHTFNPQRARKDCTTRDAAQGRTVLNVGDASYADWRRVAIHDALSDLEKFAAFNSYLTSNGVHHQPFTDLLLDHANQESLNFLPAALASLMKEAHVVLKYQGEKSIFHVKQISEHAIPKLKFQYECAMQVTDRWLSEVNSDGYASPFAAAAAKPLFEEAPIIFEIKIIIKCTITRATSVHECQFTNCEYDIEIEKCITPQLTSHFCKDLLDYVLNAIEFAMNSPGVLEGDDKVALMVRMPKRAIDISRDANVALAIPVPPQRRASILRRIPLPGIPGAPLTRANVYKLHKKKIN